MPRPQHEETSRAPGTDEWSAAFSRGMGFNDAIISEFRTNQGKVGGRWEGRDLVLLTTTGRVTSRGHTTPMVYTCDGDRFLVYASNGGASDHPDWFKNLVVDPRVTVEVGPETFEATAIPLEGDERSRLWAAHVERWPHFGEYEAKSGRVIPVVALVRG